MKKVKISFIMNLLIFILVVIGCICMFCGIKFMPASSLILANSKLEMFKYYTVDSNIFVGLVSLILLIYESRYLKNKKFIPRWVYVLKFISTASITLTFVTTLIFLTPQYGFYEMYNNSNLFFHLIVPLLTIISYVFFEKYDNEYIDSFFGVVPMMIYSIYYIYNIVSHLSNGGLSVKYDFYGFLFGNINNAFIVVPLVIIITYFMGFMLLFLNKNINK